MQRDEQQGMVDIGGDDMRLLREVRCTTYDLVTSWDDIDYRATITVGLHHNMVSHDHRVCRAYTFEPQTTAYAAIERPLLCCHLIPATRRAYYRSFEMLLLHCKKSCYSHSMMGELVYTASAAAC